MHIELVTWIIAPHTWCSQKALAVQGSWIYRTNFSPSNFESCWASKTKCGPTSGSWSRSTAQSHSDRWKNGKVWSTPRKGTTTSSFVNYGIQSKDICYTQSDWIQTGVSLNDAASHVSRTSLRFQSINNSHLLRWMSLMNRSICSWVSAASWASSATSKSIRVRNGRQGSGSTFGGAAGAPGPHL